MSLMKFLDYWIKQESRSLRNKAIPSKTGNWLYYQFLVCQFLKSRMPILVLVKYKELNELEILVHSFGCIRI